MTIAVEVDVDDLGEGERAVEEQPAEDVIDLRAEARPFERRLAEIEAMLDALGIPK